MRSALNSLATSQRIWAIFATISLLLFQLTPLIPMPAALAQQAGGLHAPVAPIHAVRSNGGSASGMSSGLTVLNSTTQVLNLSDSPILNLAGNLTNNGTLYVVSTNPLFTNATISARNIFNAPGALITTVLPASGLPGYTNALTNLSLTLVAITNIVNFGAITSAANLTTIAGGSITNMTAAGSPLATMQAANNLNVLASTIVNQGALTSLAGNINLASPSMYATGIAPVQQLVNSQMANSLASNINIDNTSGLIQALNGVVNIGGSDIAKSGALSVLGGSIVANTINIDGGSGAVQVNVDNASGVVNVSACTAQVGANSGLLNLGKLNLSGDPTFFNNNGDIEIQNDISVTQNLAILASGNIYALNPYQILTTDPGTGQGYNVYMVAGAKLIIAGAPLPTPVQQLPSNSPLIVGQTVRVIGASTSGGTITLAGSTIDARSTSGDLNGGRVNLVAYGGNATGGISNVNIFTGGSGNGVNGSVSLIAGGVDGNSNKAISGVYVDVSGGITPASVTFSAAKPVGAITFNFNGSPTGLGALTPGTLTNNDIVIDAPIYTDGGNILVSTAGALSNPATIDSSGGFFSRNAGNITLAGKTITVLNSIGALGADGADKFPAGLLNANGSAGGIGGNGGTIKLTASNAIDVQNDIIADGGRGGNGGNGAGGSAQHIGGKGGDGGGGGTAGSISLAVLHGAITQSAGNTLSALAGNGGNGGSGGPGGAGTTIMGGQGGRGGNGGAAGAAGLIMTSSDTFDTTLNGYVSLFGAKGGDGGAGGDGGSDLTKTVNGGNGGDSGTGAGGAIGGQLKILTSSGNVSVDAVDAYGGLGGNTTFSGVGGVGKIGGIGGLVSSGGNGGGGGSVFVTSTTGTVRLNNSIILFGGAGADQTANAGDGAVGSTTGGDGGRVLNAGSGAAGGMLNVSTKGAVSVFAAVDATGGIGGNMTANGGAGGTALFAGDGGNIGDAGDGGKGGSISISGGNILIRAPLTANGGVGGFTSGVGGDGANATGGPNAIGAGGNGGNVGSSGTGGMGNSISLTETNGANGVIINADLTAKGGASGDMTVNSASGRGGNGLGIGTAGFAGSVALAGDGGDGGKVDIMADRNVTIAPLGITPLHIDVSGTAGGAQAGFGGRGGDSAKGGAGGSIAASGKGGGGGSFTIKGSLTQSNISFDNTVVTAHGGTAGAYTATAGNGGNGLTDAGGAGGAIGNQGAGGGAGKVDLSGLSLTMTITTQVLANGGSTPGFSPTSGNGGNGGTVDGTGNGGVSGMVGVAGSGGKGGTILMSMPGAITIDGIGLIDTLAARGGWVLNDSAVSGKGGNGGATSGNGGNSGKILDNGSAGKGGIITLKGDSGAISNHVGVPPVIVAAGGQVIGVTARTGDGGDAGLQGNGGSSGSFGNNGNAGDGGDIKVSTSSGQISISPLIAAAGDVGLFGTFAPHTGNGGHGGTSTLPNSGNGGNSGNIGNNGFGGAGGTVTITSVTGALSPKGSTPDAQGNSVCFLAPGGIVGGAAAVTGDGGDTTSGVGGTSGSIGNNGGGGKGGKITLVSQTGDIVTPRGSMLVTGGDGGNFFITAGIGGYMADTTGKGGSTQSGRGGNSGSIGANSSGAAAGSVYITTQGDVTVAGAVVIRGGFADGSANHTGNAGNSADGNGGNSGDIGRGGNGGDAGRLDIICNGNMISSELVTLDGGNAAAQDYAPVTGNGGSGSSFGGNSGSIGPAGKAGNGGTAIIVSLAGNLNPDRILVNGGIAGDTAGIFPIPHLNFDGSMNGRTGDGGGGLISGGSAGRVGEGVQGGQGGKIVVKAGGTLQTSVQYMSDGGRGGAQYGIGGKGGDGILNTGGAGGTVASAGVGGWAGSISIESATGLTIKELEANGGDGGENAGSAGYGGKGGLQGGAGGDLGFSGTGGNGGSVEIKISKSGNLDIVGNNGTNAFGGNGGKLWGSAGKGGDGGIGGAGGSVGDSGGGGDGGMIKIDIPGDLPFLQGMLVTGGNSGAVYAVGGDGGLGTGPRAGGAGGAVNGQGDAGDGGSVSIKAATVELPGAFYIDVSGGSALEYKGVSGNGGDGGGDGGDGGAAGPPGKAGGGGMVSITTAFDMAIAGAIFSNGGDRFEVAPTTGNGGKAGLFLGIGSTGGNGGDGGSVGPSGNAGGGGRVFLTSLLGSVLGSLTGVPPNTGAIVTNGGSVSPTTPGALVTGNGGDGAGFGGGGKGGVVELGASGGDGGMIRINAYGNIYVANYGSSGGDVQGQYGPHTGNGGTAGNVRGGGGNGGVVTGAGSGGDGGSVTLKSLVGEIGNNSITARGGSVGDMVAVGGNGGSASGQGDGGEGGSIGNNGKGGTGGSISVTTLGLVTVAGNWNVTGGDVGGNSAKGGDGNTAGPLTAGGDGGDVGDNGLAGKGGMISVGGYDGALTFNGSLLANGGSVLGAQTGKGGDGFNGGAGGGGGGRVGDAGEAGGGGSIELSTRNGIITANLISAAGGLTTLALQQGQAGKGGNSTGTGPDNHGGTGGDIGSGAEGGSGGRLSIKTGSGDINILGLMLANGADGNSNNGHAGDAGTGNIKGGTGGSVGLGGLGGGGGAISLFTDNGIITVGTLNASGGKGGDQNAVAGLSQSGNSAGGTGGSVGQAGDGGAGGLIAVNNTNRDTFINGDLLANGGAGGNNAGTAQDGSTGTQLNGGDGGTVNVGGGGGKGGKILLNSPFGVITTNGQINANGAIGGDQTGHAGNGGSSVTGKGGNGGSLLKAGDGGAGGTITINAPSTPAQNITVAPTANGALGGTFTGAGGTGGSGNPNGINGRTGTNGAQGRQGTITITVASLFDNFDESSSPLSKRRKNQPQIALKRLPSDTHMALITNKLRCVAHKVIIDGDSEQLASTADPELVSAEYVQRENQKDSSALPIAMIQPSSPDAAFIQGVAVPVTNEGSVASLVTESACTDELIGRLAACHSVVVPGNSENSIQLQKGEALFAPRNKDVTINLPNGIVMITAGAAAIVSVDADGCTAVRTIHNKSQNDVRFTWGTSTTPVELGWQVEVFGQGSAQHRNNAIATRNRTTKVGSDGSTLTVSEFSLLSALSHHNILQAMQRSSHKADRQQIERVMKNVSILTYLTAHKGAFQNR